MILLIAVAAMVVAVIVYYCLNAGDLEKQWMEEMQRREELQGKGEMDAGRTDR